MAPSGSEDTGPTDTADGHGLQDIGKRAPNQALYGYPATGEKHDGDGKGIAVTGGIKNKYLRVQSPIIRLYP